jgi:hypothetical protein
MLSASAAKAQTDGGDMAATSSLIGVRLPGGARRVNAQSVPADIDDALGKLIAAAGNGRLRQGAKEVLVWAGGGYRKSNAAGIIRQVTDNMRGGGWEYAVGEQNSEFIVFSSLDSSVPKKRGIVGFWIPSNESLLLAWAELLPAFSANVDSAGADNRPPHAAVRPVSNDGAVEILNVEKNALWVNVMGNEMPVMPQFPKLSPKPNRVRGYVKDWMGKPLAGATIGIRGSFFAGHYSGAQGTTDATGYYEFVVPKGSAHFYNAGYQIEWGAGQAAVSLHPADGKLDSFTTVDGAVENFVLLPYGITSRENLQNSSRNPSTYYGGSIYVHYYAAEADDGNRSPSTLIENSLLEITLTPEDAAAGKSFVIRQPVGFAGNVTINNIPLGRYKITAKVGGKTLKLKETRKFNPLFGLTPNETVGAASILFVPTEARAAMVGPQNGTWDSVSLDVLMP